jgi:hypothetical protein
MNILNNKVYYCIVFILSSLIIGLPVFAQPPDTLWLRTYGGLLSDGGRDVIQTSDNGYLIAGWTWSFGPGRSDIFLVKTNAYGDTLWTRAWGSLFSDHYPSIVELSDTTYVIAYTRGLTTGNADIGLVRIDATGDTLWTRSYGSLTVDGCYDITRTIDSGLVLVGWTYAGAGGSDIYVIKTDMNGDTLWTRTYGGTEDDYGYSVQQTDDHGYIITGFTNSFSSGSYDIYTIKINENGGMLWSDVLGGSADDFGYGVQKTADSSYIVVGATWSFGIGTPLNSNVLIAKYHPSGDTAWTKVYGAYENERAYSIAQTIDSNFIITGYTDSYGNGADDVYLLKIDANSDTLWTATYGGPDHDHGFSIIQDKDTSYTITGSTLSFGAGDYDMFLLKTETDHAIAERYRADKSVHGIYLYPNPFSHTVEISWPSTDPGSMIKIYDITGRMVKKFDKSLDKISWSGDDQNGNALANGIFIIVCKGSSVCQARSVALIR